MSENQKRIRIAVFASGNGSNARKINEHFSHHPVIEIALIVCNDPEAGVLKIASEQHIPTLLIEKNRFREEGYLSFLQEKKIDFIVLAGFLWKAPPCLTRAYQGRIVNIHPALLPSYGGKGMYGMAVHRAVIEHGEKKSGITIHFADDAYDHGKIIFQKQIDVVENETPETLAEKIHILEHNWYSKVIEKMILDSEK